MVKKAFTLIELLIVVAIIEFWLHCGTKFSQCPVRAKIARCHSDMNTLSNAFEMYSLITDDIPTWDLPTTGTPTGSILA